MEALSEAKFKQNYARHLQHLKLNGLQPKTEVTGENVWKDEVARTAEQAV